MCLTISQFDYLAVVSLSSDWRPLEGGSGELPHQSRHFPGGQRAPSHRLSATVEPHVPLHRKDTSSAVRGKRMDQWFVSGTWLRCTKKKLIFTVSNFQFQGIENFWNVSCALLVLAFLTSTCKLWRHILPVKRCSSKIGPWLSGTVLVKTQDGGSDNALQWASRWRLCVQGRHEVLNLLSMLWDELRCSWHLLATWLASSRHLKVSCLPDSLSHSLLLRRARFSFQSL